MHIKLTNSTKRELTESIIREIPHLSDRDLINTWNIANKGKKLNLTENDYKWISVIKKRG